MLKNLKNKMYQYIEKYGLNSDKALEISQKVDIEINKYYSSNSCMKYYYEQSLYGINEYFKKRGDLPTISDWNNYANKNNLLSNISIEYISNTKFDTWCRDSVKNLELNKSDFKNC